MQTAPAPKRRPSAAAAAMMDQGETAEEDVLAAILAEARERIRGQMTPSQIEDPSVEDMQLAESIVRPLVDAALSRALHQGARITQGQEQILRLIMDEIFGFGPLSPYLDDAEVEEVIINGPDSISIIHAERGKELTPVRFRGLSEVTNFVNRAAATGGRWLDRSNPKLDARMSRWQPLARHHGPADGQRAHRRHHSPPPAGGADTGRPDEVGDHHAAGRQVPAHGRRRPFEPDRHRGNGVRQDEFPQCYV